MAKPGTTARRAAVRLLNEVLGEGRPMSELAPQLEGLEPPERARAQRLAMTVLRHLGPADVILKPYLRKAPPLDVRNVLRLGVVELCVEGGAAHGVVDSAVSLARGLPKGRHLSGMVNAVLRRVAEDGPAKWVTLPPTRLPDWLRKPLLVHYGKPAVQTMESVQAAEPPLDLTPRDPDSAAALAERLEATVLPGGSLRLTSSRQVSLLPGFAEGEWWVQDVAAALPVRLMAVQPGERIADLCAAPGGKTMQLAAAGAEVTALDLSSERLVRLRDNLVRTGLKAEVVVGDALDWQGGPFDAVLLDAPCSASGTIRRHPDLPHAKEDKDITQIVQLQARMIDHALGLLKPGGRLVYCVCSLLQVEGEDQVTAALARHPGLGLLPLDMAQAAVDPRWQSPEGGLRLRPDLGPVLGGMDGFYIALLGFGGDSPGASV